MKVLLRPVARKYFERMSESDKGHVRSALKRLEKEPPEGDIKPMTGKAGYFRLRVGKYRALYRIEAGAVLVMNIDPRGQAYKKDRGKK